MASDMYRKREIESSHSPSENSLYASSATIAEYPSSQETENSSLPLYFSTQAPTLLKSVNISTPSTSLADRIFGRRLTRGHLTLELARRIAQDRSRIHQYHLEKFSERRTDLQNRLKFASRPYPLIPPQQAMQLERLLQQLETDLHREELTYWKDIAEIRGKLIEEASEYKAMKERHYLLGRLDIQDG